MDCMQSSLSPFPCSGQVVPPGLDKDDPPPTPSKNSVSFKELKFSQNVKYRMIYGLDRKLIKNQIMRCTLTVYKVSL